MNKRPEATEVQHATQTQSPLAHDAQSPPHSRSPSPVDRGADSAPPEHVAHVGRTVENAQFPYPAVSRAHQWVLALAALQHRHATYEENVMARGVNLGPRSRVDPAGRFPTRTPRTVVQVVQRGKRYERPGGPTGRHGRGHGRHRRTRRGRGH
jgi:hypothetical protein